MNDDLAPRHDPRWKALIADASQTRYQCLALKLILVRLRIDYQRDATRLPALVDELRRFFEVNRRFAGADHDRIFGRLAA